MVVIASMIVWVSACLLSSAASASSATPTLTTTAPTATHVALKSRAEVFLGVSLKNVERSELSPVNATRYYDVLEGVVLECLVAPIEGAGGFTGRFAKMDPTDLQFSQRSAGGNGRAVQLRESMANGWNGKAVDAVQTPHGITSIDNTRIAVAQELGIPQVPVMVRQMSDPLPQSMLGRFGNSKTWGEALQYRTGNQRPPLPSTGTPTRPRLPGS